MSIKQNLGLRIRTLRKKHKYTREQFSEMINIAPRTLYGIESGKNFVTAETLEKIVLVLNISPEDLFTFEEEISPENITEYIKTNVDKLNSEPDKLLLLYKTFKHLLNS